MSVWNFPEWVRVIREPDYYTCVPADYMTRTGGCQTSRRLEVGFMAGVCCFKRVLYGWVFDETFGRWSGGGEPPEDLGLGLWRGFAALRGF
jgi:hypothetical protein